MNKTMEQITRTFLITYFHKGKKEVCREPIDAVDEINARCIFVAEKTNKKIETTIHKIEKF